jgi:molecular chaperone GrpE
VVKRETEEDADDSPVATDPLEPENTVSDVPPRKEEQASAEPEAGTAAAVDVEALKRERDDYYDRFLRKSAEFENYRKRVERERREQADHTVTDLLVDLLNVVDDFERALAVGADEESEGYRKGVELIYNKLQDLLRRRGVKPIEALGADFDPNVHQAVAQEPSDDHREGEVTEEMRRGYMLGDRLLRPAMVKVASRE